MIQALDDTGERMMPEQSGLNTFWEHIYRYRFAMQYVKDLRVVDIACGEGYGTAAIKKAGARSVIGIDICPIACEHVRQKYGVDALVGDATQIPLPDSSVDVVVSFETIEHVLDTQKFMEECLRILTPQGLLIVSTPNKPIYNIGALQRWPHTANSFHCMEMDETEFTTVLNRNFSTWEIFNQITLSPTKINPALVANNAFKGRLYRKIYRTYMAMRDNIQFNLHNIFCLHVPSEYRQIPIDLILSKEKQTFGFLNPYKVRSEGNRNLSIYFVAVARV